MAVWIDYIMALLICVKELLWLLTIADKTQPVMLHYGQDGHVLQPIWTQNNHRNAVKQLLAVDFLHLLY